MPQPNPFVFDVTDLPLSQRRALAESVVSSSPTVDVDEDDLPEQDRWTLRKGEDAEQVDYDDEIEYLIAIKADADQGKLTPLEDYWPI